MADDRRIIYELQREADALRSQCRRQTQLMVSLSSLPKELMEATAKLQARYDELEFSYRHEVRQRRLTTEEFENTIAIMQRQIDAKTAELRNVTEALMSSGGQDDQAF